jgi:hypothetical protein
MQTLLGSSGIHSVQWLRVQVQTIRLAPEWRLTVTPVQNPRIKRCVPPDAVYFLIVFFFIYLFFSDLNCVQQLRDNTANAQLASVARNSEQIDPFANLARERSLG